jgi:hypothetical protein
LVRSGATACQRVADAGSVVVAAAIGSSSSRSIGAGSVVDSAGIISTSRMTVPMCMAVPFLVPSLT